MFKATLIATTLLWSLNGCAAVKTDSPIQDRPDWIFTPANEEPAKLIFGKPDTDDIDILFWCRKELHVVRATVGSDEDEYEHATLNSRAVTLHLNLFQDQYTGLVGDVPLDAPILQTFSRTGELRMSLDDGRVSDLSARSRDGHREITKFFEACR